MRLQHHRGGIKLRVDDLRAARPVIAVPPSPASRAPAMTGGVFVVARYDFGNRNRLGGHFGVFARAPGRGTVAIEQHGAGRGALTFRYDHQPPGWAGLWIHLFETTQPPARRVFLDTTRARWLTFDVRGQLGAKQQLGLKLADERWERKDDALFVTDVAGVVVAGQIERTWRRVWVDLNELPARIDRKALASLVLQVKGPTGTGWVQLRDLALAMHKNVSFPKPPASTSRPQSRPLRKALWLWETRRLLGQAEEQRTLVEFCRRDHITDLFLQLPHDAPDFGSTKRRSFRSEWKALAELIGLLHDAGVRVDALDGHPRFALAEHHGYVLRAIDQVAAFNRSAGRGRRFSGFRLDVEPYLLAGFRGVGKQRILRQYLTLLRRARQRARGVGLSLGADIPFWFDGLNRYFEPSAKLDGRPVSELVVDAVDNLAIMDYRTVAYGADGVIAHGHDELKYAASRGKPVLVGLETVSLPDETIEEYTTTSGHASNGPCLHLRETNKGSVWIERRSSCARSGNVAAGNIVVLERRASIAVPASKLTFARRHPNELERVMRRVARELRCWPSFVGFAIHSYESYWPWRARHRRRPER